MFRNGNKKGDERIRPHSIPEKSGSVYFPFFLPAGFFLAAFFVAHFIVTILPFRFNFLSR